MVEKIFATPNLKKFSFFQVGGYEKRNYFNYMVEKIFFTHMLESKEVGLFDDEKLKRVRTPIPYW